MSDLDYKFYSFGITEDDIFLAYAAFQRAIHHFNTLQDTPKCHKEKFQSDYKEIFKHVKKFCKEKRDPQSVYQYSVFDVLLNYITNFFEQNRDLDQTCLEKYDEWEQEFNKHVEKFPTLANVSNAHAHAVDNHYVTDLMSELTDKRNSFYTLKNFYTKYINYPFDPDSGWKPSSLKEAMFDIPSNRRLRWCARLLVAYHYENECDVFMTAAYRFCLKAVNLHPILDCKSKEFFRKFMSLYLDFFKNHLTDAFPYREKFMTRCACQLFYMNSWNFRVLLEFGASYGYSQEHLAALRWFMPGAMRGLGRISPNENTTRKCEYYCLQVFFLYFHGYRPLTGQMLQAIWASIPEPFLTLEDIYACFYHMVNYGGQIWWSLEARSSSISDRAKQVHLWYSDVVGAIENDCKSPRSLQHLSRCVVRTHLEFPIDVSSFDFPQKLKDYIMLKE